MAKKDEEEKRRISPAVIVPVALVGLLGLGGLIYAATREPKEEPPEEVYYCPYCGEMFLTPELLAAHITFFHPEEEPVEPEPEPPPVPEQPITFSNLVVPTEVVPVGKAILITFDITNPNDTQAVVTINLEGAFQNSWDKVIPANSTITESFTVKPLEPGSYLILIDGLSATLVADILSAEVTKMTAAPSVVTIGHTVDITVTVGNRNYYATITYDVVLTGAIQASQTVTLAPHEVKNVVFTETVTWIGRQDVYCENQVVAVRGEAAPVPEPEYLCEFCGLIFENYPELAHHIAVVHFGVDPASPHYQEIVGLTLSMEALKEDLEDCIRLGNQACIDNLTIGLHRYEKAIADCASGKLLYLDLTSAEKGRLGDYVREVMGTTFTTIQASYGGAFWVKYVPTSELAPGWSLGWPVTPPIPPEEEPPEEEPPPETELRHHFRGWPVDFPIPDCIGGIGPWTIIPDSVYWYNNQYFQMIECYYWAWEDTGEPVYPCS